jgi:hypothetical protein
MPKSRQGKLVKALEKLSGLKATRFLSQGKLQPAAKALTGWRMD